MPTKRRAAALGRCEARKRLPRQASGARPRRCTAPRGLIDGGVSFLQTDGQGAVLRPEDGSTSGAVGDRVLSEVERLQAVRLEPGVPERKAVDDFNLADRCRHHCAHRNSHRRQYRSACSATPTTLSYGGIVLYVERFLPHSNLKLRVTSI
ncbi:hypothetical protein JG688_00007006 [Phytophthora aleatoria]|uniref:Uncharacterized protein n=1 Tax=Phytophthora aleatoria TaxID=2496075 RepID=A0A8J5IMC4_9STRA|nr:hypothetical protein JG688_00007006 [Phytophthora aleatoria]